MSRDTSHLPNCPWHEGRPDSDCTCAKKAVTVKMSQLTEQPQPVETATGRNNYVGISTFSDGVRVFWSGDTSGIYIVSPDGSVQETDVTSDDPLVDRYGATPASADREVTKQELAEIYKFFPEAADSCPDCGDPNGNDNQCPTCKRTGPRPSENQ